MRQRAKSGAKDDSLTLKFGECLEMAEAVEKAGQAPLGGVWRKKRTEGGPDLVPSFVRVGRRESIFRARGPKILFQQPRLGVHLDDPCPPDGDYDPSNCRTSDAGPESPLDVVCSLRLGRDIRYVPCEILTQSGHQHSPTQRFVDVCNWLASRSLRRAPAHVRSAPQNPHVDLGPRRISRYRRPAPWRSVPSRALLPCHSRRMP